MTAQEPKDIRQRLVSWEDPTPSAGKARTMSGLAYMQAMIDGHYPPPPIASVMNMRLDAVERGRATFSLLPDESLYNPIGSVHGGVAATLCDSALGCAVHTTLEAGQAYTTVELKVNYIRPILATTGRLTCIAQVIHAGRRTATADCRIEDERGKLYAHGSTTCLIFAIPTSA